MPLRPVSLRRLRLPCQSPSSADICRARAWGRQRRRVGCPPRQGSQKAICPRKGRGIPASCNPA